MPFPLAAAAFHQKKKAVLQQQKKAVLQQNTAKSFKKTVNKKTSKNDFQEVAQPTNSASARAVVEKTQALVQ